MCTDEHTIFPNDEMRLAATVSPNGRKYANSLSPTDDPPAWATAWIKI
jgi:hypothetical protein